MNLANKATILRMILVPVFVACFFFEKSSPQIITAVVFIIAALTDTFDGWYARKYHLVSDFGKLMDPMADKLLNCTAVILLQAAGKIHPILTVIIIAREIIISAFRLSAVEKGIVIAAGMAGKIKTVVQMLAIGSLLLDNPIFGRFGVPMDQILIWASGVLSIISLVGYIRNNLQVFGETK
ncbi:MAG: CDP-diacylglycerol--glycerol-3-phosphate 3-phosphatidyltransferase [Clostridia bacterium]|nr:CDP-diacylglycerol--glycerol-3-phosphate 3-phosphatidyltransferase [Clostridia bacterium]